MTQHATNILFNDALKTHSPRTIAAKLSVQLGTVQRWMKQGMVPPFYKNDLLRVLGHECVVGIAESDQFYTSPSLALTCFADLKATLKTYGISTDGYCFIEPSAGCGYFYSVLPEGNRIGIDIDPQPAPYGMGCLAEIIKGDFLKWNPPQGKYIVIGNPPFGRNGKAALDFVFKAFSFADYVAFILPPIFNSTGKGSCHNRLVKLGHALLHNRDLGNGDFFRPDGVRVGVATVFQVWAKHAPEGYVPPVKRSCASYVDIYNLYISYKPSRPSANVGLVGQCDIYIPRSFWGSKPIKASLDFADIPYKDGYGLIIKRDKQRILDFILGFDWREVAHVSTNGSMSLRKDIIISQLVKAGFSDDN